MSTIWPVKPEVIRFDSAEGFVGALLKTSSSWGPPSYSSPYVYRGHFDAAWQLKPKAWRDGGQKILEPLRNWLRPQVKKYTLRFNRGLLDNPGRFELSVATAAELYAVCQFCDLADELGLSVPESHKVLDVDEIISWVTTRELGPDPDSIVRLPSNFEDDFPAVPFIFATHHGIPTRYLDWTRDPLVAAYFATVGNEKERISDELCIWASEYQKRVTGWIQWHSAPRAVHSYLHAQSGTCSFHSNPVEFFSEFGRWPSFDESLKMRMDDQSPKLVKYVLPASEREDLVLDLQRRRVTLAHMMPTLDNVAGTVSGRWKSYVV